MLKLHLLLLLFIGTVFLVVAEDKQEKELLIKVLNREKRLEKVVEKITDFIGAKNASVGTEDVKADAASKDAVSAVEDPEEMLELLESDSEEDDAQEKHENVASNDKTTLSRGQRVLEDLEAEIKDEVEDGIEAKLMERKIKSDAKPWWGRRRRRRHIVVDTAVKVAGHLGNTVRRFWGKK